MHTYFSILKSICSSIGDDNEVGYMLEMQIGLGEDTVDQVWFFRMIRRLNDTKICVGYIYSAHGL